MAKKTATVNPDFIDCTGRAWPLLKSKYASNYSPIHVFDYMTGKMEGIPSISTSCLENPICIERMKNGEAVCFHCFAAASLDRFKTAGIHAANNFHLLNAMIIPDELLPRFRNVSIVRIESFGDVASVIQAINYLNICLANPSVTFAAWTKNANIWNAAIDEWLAGEKPENLSLVYSSFKLNQPAAAAEYFTKDGRNNFDHVFTVFDKAAASTYGPEFITCGARDCATCRRCYKKDPADFSVRELLK